MAATTYLSLGSNLGNREANLHDAIRRLGELGTLKKISSFYETAPVEVTAQPWFMNCVVELETALSPRELLNGLLTIEQAMGRERLQPKGPRLIDLDIVLYGSQIVHEHGLTIPHPAMHERRFVLEPLAEIASNAVHPGLHKTTMELLNMLPEHSGDVRKLVNDRHV